MNDANAVHRQRALQRESAPVEKRVAAIEAAFESRGMEPGPYIEAATRVAEQEWVPQNGARVVAKAWTDPAFRERLLGNGKAAVEELGLSMPAHHRHLVVLENTPTVHNDLLHALLVHRVHDHRLAAGLVQGPRLPSPRRARIAHRAARDGPRPAPGDRDPRLGHDDRYPLHGAAGAAAADHRLAAGEAGIDRHEGIDDRCCPTRRSCVMDGVH